MAEGSEWNHHVYWRVSYFSEISKDPLFVGADIIRPMVKMTNIGELLEFSINDIKNHYENVSILKYCIMPDHVHLIISIMHKIVPINGGRMISAPTVSPEIGRWILK